MRYIRKLDAVPGTSYDVFSNLGFFETVWEADAVGMTNNLKQVFTESVALTGLSLTGIGERVVITDAVTGELKYRLAAAIAPPVSLVNGGFAAGGESLVEDGVGPNLATKGLVAGTGISLTSDLNDVTISTTSNITVNTISSALVDIFMVDTVKFLGDTQFTGLSDFTDNTLVDMTSAGTLTLDLTGSNVVGLPSAGVVGPVVSTLNSIPTYNNITGDLIKNNSTCLIDGVGNVQCPTIDCVSGDILDLECTNIICNLDLNTEDLTTQTILCGGSLTLDASTSTYAGAIVNFAGATIQNFPLSFGDVSFVGVAPTLGQLAYYDDNSGQNINNSAILVNGSNDLTNINVLGASNIISTTCQSNSVTTNVISPIAPGVNILYAGNLHNFLDSIQVTNNITCATIEVTTSLTLDGTLISVDSDPTNDNDTFLTVGPLGELQQTIIEPVYGGLFTTNNGTLTTIISVNTFTLLGSIYTNLATSAGISFPTQAITISSTQSGVCTVGGSVSIESQSASFIQYELAIFKNGVELEGSRRLTSTTDSSEDKNIHTSTTTSYVLNDVFDYRIRNITGTTDILITNCTLIINKL